MAAESQSASVAFSILDRLIDLEPNVKLDPAASAWSQVGEFKANLCRDLTALLNTRRAEEDFEPAYAESTDSLLTFGITDFTSYNLKSAVEQEQVRRAIERAIRKFEPRLTQVEVSVAPPNPLRPILLFQISALMRIESSAESVVFDATLQRESRRISVVGGRA